MNGVRVAVHQSSSRIERRKLFSITRSPSVAVVSGNRAQVDDGVELAAVKPARQIRRRHEVGQLALGEIAPLAVGTEKVANGHIGPPRIVERSYDV